MKWVVRGFLLVITLVFLMLAGATYMLVTFNPDDYKPQIAQAVTEATGRPFAINGEIKATLFPILGFTAEGVEMGNADGFGNDEFLKVGSIQAGVKVQPLFEKRIELTKITLMEPAINVIKLRNGKTNLEFKKNGDTKVETTDSTAPAMDLSVEEIEISKARVIYTDQEKGESWTIDPLNLTLPGFKPGTSTAIKIDMTMKRGDEMEVRIDAAAAMNAAPDAGTFTLSGVKADVNLKSPALARDMTVALRGDMALDNNSQTLEGKDIKLSWQGTDIASAVKITNFKSPKVTFSASAPSVDLDTLMGAFAKKEKAANDNKDLLPFAVIRSLTLDGTIQIDNFKMAGLVATDLKATLAAAGGQLKISPITGTFYEGALSSVVTIDARNDLPRLAATGTLENIQVGPIMAAKMGQDYVAGKAGFDFNLESRGRNLPALRSAAGGSFGFDFG
ncbi:MAG: AsmA family protein, partial [Alphaproteobacteria bacterium]|nr:AsmA family protein [Alphaproteobacteria bacterium]